MKMLIALLFVLVEVASGQPSPAPQIQYVTADPTGNACSNTAIALRTPNGTLYTCQSGVYALASGGGGGGGITGVLQPLVATLASGVVTIACSSGSPCGARIDGVTYTYTSNMTCNAPTGSPQARVYVSNGITDSTQGGVAGHVTIRSSLSSGLTCSGIDIQYSQSSFPTNAPQVAQLSATSPGTWDAPVNLSSIQSSDSPPGPSTGCGPFTYSGNQLLIACSGTGSNSFANSGIFYFTGYPAYAPGSTPPANAGANTGIVTSFSTYYRTFTKFLFNLQTAGSSGNGIIIGVYSSDLTTLLCYSSILTGTGATTGISATGNKVLTVAGGSDASAGTCTLPAGGYKIVISADSNTVAVLASAQAPWFNADAAIDQANAAGAVSTGSGASLALVANVSGLTWNANGPGGSSQIPALAGK